jgi:uncharacterized membrane protein
MLDWSSPYPAWVYLSLAVACVVLIAIARWTAISDRLRRWTFFLPRMMVLALLLGVLLNPVRRREHRLPDQPAQVQFLIDSSRSMALEQPQSRSLQVQQMIQTLDSQLQQQANSPQVQLFRFGQQLSSAADLSQLQPIDNVTRLAEALEQLPSRFSRELPRGVVVFSDGVIDDPERLEEVATAFRDIKVPIHVFPVGDSELRGDVAIDELVVPPRVDVGVKAPIRGVVRGTGYAGERVVLQVRASARPELPPLATLPVTLSETPQPFELIVEANPEYGELVLEVPPLKDEVSNENNRIPFQLSKATRKLKVLYMEGTGANEFHWVRDALIEDKDIECVALVADQQYVQRPRMQRVDDPYRGFPATREELLEFDCVICSDIAVGAFTREQLDWTVDLVDKQGGGFMMVGGITSFGSGGWDQTVWDKLIPADMSGGSIGRGSVYHTFQVRIPEEALAHPIWKIIDDPVQNRRAIERMPPFHGTNYMQRLKPAATLLAESVSPIPGADIMPIFACQSYGRGRTFAFAPDTTADWGRDFERHWGEGGDNRYFRRFWRNAVRWLTENSVSGNRRLQVDTDRVIYRAGQPIQITARAFDDELRETIEYQVSAQVKTKDTGTPASIAGSTPLVPTPPGSTYTGEMDTLSLMSASEGDASAVISSHEIEVIATHKGSEVARSSVRVMVLPDLHELVQPRAQSDMLEQLASATGGTTLHGPAELASLLQNMPATPGDSVISRQPLWDSPWLAFLIVTLLAVEWILRRLSGY